MEGKTHAAVGTACGFVVSVVMPSELTSTICNVVFSCIGALFPDIDCKGSIASKMFRLSYVVEGVILLAYFVERWLKITASSSQVLPSTCFLMFTLFGEWGKHRPHREATHSIVSCLFTSAMVYGVAGVMPAFSYCVGYLSHLCLDLLNRKGECILWPLHSNWCLGLCLADGVLSKIFRYAGCVVSCILALFVLRGLVL